MEHQDDSMLTCSRHRKRPATLICRHLNDGGAGKGFYVPSDSDDSDFKTAWCHECELMLLDKGTWEEMEDWADYLRCVCDGCYEEIRDRNYLLLST